MARKLRIGAVNYLNTKPLIYDLAIGLRRNAELVLDYPSRLADDLARRAAGRGVDPFDRVLSRIRLCIVSDACIACRGPVLSVKLFGRAPIDANPHAGSGRRLAHQRGPGADPAGRALWTGAAAGAAADRSRRSATPRPTPCC